MRAKKSPRLIVSRILIITGVALIAFALGYEALDYPWHLLFADAASEFTEPPDPEPLPDDILDFEPPPLSTPGEDGEPDISSLDEVNPADTHISSGTGGGSQTAKYTQIGVIKVPKLNISANIIEGTDGRQMNYGVAHVAGTALPGGRGNCVLSGHRAYVHMHPFRHLDKMENGNNVMLKYNGVTYTYTTVNVFTVEPNDVWVLKKIAGIDYGATLLTCTPVLNPTHRLIVQLRLTHVDGEVFTPPTTGGNAPPSGQAEPSPSPSPDVNSPVSASPSPSDAPPPDANTPVPAAPSPSSAEDAPVFAPPEETPDKFSAPPDNGA